MKNSVLLSSHRRLNRGNESATSLLLYCNKRLTFRRPVTLGYLFLLTKWARIPLRDVDEYFWLLLTK